MIIPKLVSSCAEKFFPHRKMSTSTFFRVGEKNQDVCKEAHDTKEGNSEFVLEGISNQNKRLTALSTG